MQIFSGSISEMNTILENIRKILANKCFQRCNKKENIQNRRTIEYVFTRGTILRNDSNLFKASIYYYLDIVILLKKFPVRFSTVVNIEVYVIIYSLNFRMNSFQVGYYNCLFYAGSNMCGLRI